jgi:hypothetical protein
MRSISAVIVAAAALLTMAAGRPTDDQLFMKGKPKARHKASGPTSLKGYALGMSLDAFKKRPAPRDLSGGTRVLCSDDPARQAALGPALTPRFSGETVCGFQLLRGGKWEPGQLMLDATHGATVTFHFFKGALVQIESQEDAALSDAIIQSLTTQYGQPKQVNKTTSQSISNEIRTQINVTWLNGVDSIVVISPNLGTDRMSLIYTDLKSFAAMQSSGGNLM